MKRYNFKKYDRVPVEITSIYDLFDKETCRTILGMAELHQCHHNSVKIAEYLNYKGHKDVMYCEGSIYGGMPHCWNKIGDKYFDATIEKHSSTPDSYQLYRTFKIKDIYDVCSVPKMWFITYCPSYNEQDNKIYQLEDNGELKIIA